MVTNRLRLSGLSVTNIDLSTAAVTVRHDTQQSRGTEIWPCCKAPQPFLWLPRLFQEAGAIRPPGHLAAIRWAGKRTRVLGEGAIWRQGKEEVGVVALLRDKHNYYSQGSPWRIQMGISLASAPACLIAERDNQLTRNLCFRRAFFCRRMRGL